VNEFCGRIIRAAEWVVNVMLASTWQGTECLATDGVCVEVC
jgi:hypothetical protein